MKPTRGRIVHYRFTSADADAINRRRGPGRPSRIHGWPETAQAHVGNPVVAGRTAPMIIVCVFPNEYGAGVPGVNGQVLLDGNDSLWVTSIEEGDAPGQWSWEPE